MENNGFAWSDIRMMMGHGVNVWQTLTITSLVWFMCCLPSFFITPINSVLKYLACVIIYPKVRLTWAGILGCIPDLRVLLESRIYLNTILCYLAVWVLWPACKRACNALKPPIGKGIKCCVDKNRMIWNYTKTCTSQYIPFQYGYCTWNDLQWLWNNQLRKEYGAFRASQIIGWQVRGCTSKVLHVLLELKNSRRLIGRLHSKTQAIVWRITSFHVKLHILFWSYVAQIVCRLVVTNPERYLRETHRDVLERNTTKFLLYRLLPLRCISRLWGLLHSTDLPVWIRPYAYKLYIRMFGCNLDEALITDLKYYNNLSQFFRRSLKAEVRPINSEHSVVSPVDGTVVYSGDVQNGVLEQVKGVTYSLSSFLGDDTSFLETIFSRKSTEIKCRSQTEADPNSAFQLMTSLPFCPTINFSVDISCQSNGTASEIDCKNTHCENLDPMCQNDVDLTSMTSLQQQSEVMSREIECAKNLILNPNNVLYQCVIYLAPGDYHRFHSPVEWTVCHRRHFPGHLFSVHPKVANWLQGLFVLNERVLYTGHWQHGFFSMTAVGALNVGSINVFFDEDLKTNLSKSREQSCHETTFVSEVDNGIPLKKGEVFGEFNLGSTVVLVFEAPADFELRVDSGSVVRYGQGIVRI